MGGFIKTADSVGCLGCRGSGRTIGFADPKRLVHNGKATANGLARYAVGVGET